MTKLVKNGPIYPAFSGRRNYDEKTDDCISQTVTNLLEQSTTSDHPGMLLGKIQSGKTRTFLGVIALAFDNGYDVAVVFTKGTKALAQQTLARLNSEFKPEIERDLIHVFDIMSLPDPLAEYELAHKIVIVCKKEDDNIRRLDTAFFHTNSVLATRRALIIDDEADFHVFGIGGTATLHLAGLLGFDTVDSSGWRNRAARGIIQLPGSGERIVAALGNWRGRRPTTDELARLKKCRCPAFQTYGVSGLRASGLAGFCNRATHNLWILLEEAKWVSERLDAGSYRRCYKKRLNNTIYLPLITTVIQRLKKSGA